MNTSGPNFEYQKGNIDSSVYKSGAPIPKDLIAEDILEFLYSMGEENSELLRISDFKLEFLIFAEIKGFFKFDIVKPVGGKNSAEIILMGENLSKVISLIRDCSYDLDISSN